MHDTISEQTKTINVWGFDEPTPRYFIRCHHGHKLDRLLAPAYLPPATPGSAVGAAHYRHSTRLTCLPVNGNQGRCTDGVSFWFEYVGQCPDCGQHYRIATAPKPCKKG